MVSAPDGGARTLTPASGASTEHHLTPNGLSPFIHGRLATQRVVPRAPQHSSEEGGSLQSVGSSFLPSQQACASSLWVGSSSTLSAF